MKTGDTVTTMTGKSGPIVALVDGYLADVQIVCCLVEKHQRGQKPGKKGAIRVVCRYHRDDLWVVAQDSAKS